MTIQKIVSLLRNISPGAVPARTSDELFKLVVAGWHEFSGSREASMDTRKISRGDGPEEVTWSPPYLSFVIIRHGGAVLGSTRGERQRWELNLERGTADHAQIGFRQLRPVAPRMDVKGLADAVCKAVGEGPNSASRLVADGVVVWKDDLALTVYHGKIVTGSYRRTVSGRRKRFIADLKSKIEVIGWSLDLVGRGLSFRKTQ